ncbi:Myo-inositol-1-phosphate synthase [Thermogladius calderae 1633]|uniref:Myo-inositol-1-phosphate synthase n=1 Tax=Thermogladius calderae (strain DSM 22663 / VKM B-2946 / 1633) TaxID=1184251 RepID=I3TEA6_THEC1|nr:myo-inositol-1-phosphate synthase [Thermogladius calderae]AFK51094.1 Myo-inositol-1-phosphate synthase [Thermogladius calderae 1633]
MRVVVIGQGMAASYLEVGLERLKRNEIPDYGVPLRDWVPVKYDDIEIVAAYDVDERKIGKTAYELAREYFNSSTIPGKLKEIQVRRGIHLGSLKGLPYKARGLEEKYGLEKSIEMLVDEWKSFNADVFLNVITTEPVEPIHSVDELEARVKEGYLTASQAYAYAVAQYARRVKPAVLINAIPSPVATDQAFVDLYKASNAVVFGDDAATGATPLTADLLEHLFQRNRRVLDIAQFNIGGNTDFLALTEPERNIMKKKTKSSMVSDILGYEAPNYIRPTGFLEPLGDKKFVAMIIEYMSFGDFKDEIYVIMRVNDKPAIVGVLIDLIRLGKIALERGLYGTVYEVNAFYTKKPGPPGVKAVSKVKAFYRLLDWLGIKDPRGI